MIIFLDFDGVCHGSDRDESLFCRTPLLWEILRAVPTARVVFSTSWRDEHSIEMLVDCATSGGGEDLANRFIGCTPNLEHDGHYGRRDLEIECWVNDNHHGSPWIALDDMPELFFDSDPDSEDGLHPNLYLVNHRTGLIASDVPNIIERLKSCR